MTLFVPIIIAALIVYASIKRIDLYDAFVEGAAQALPNLVRILPNMAAILTAIVLFKGSGMLNKLTSLIAPVSEGVGIPSPIMPLYYILILIFLHIHLNLLLKYYYKNHLFDLLMLLFGMLYLYIQLLNLVLSH